MMQKPKLKSVKRPRLSFNDRHPFVVPVVTLVCLLIISLFGVLMFGGQTVGPADSKVVQLHADGEIRNIPTRAKTVRQVLERTGVELLPEDVVEPSLDASIDTQEFSINIYRAKPVVVVDETGKKTLIKTAETSTTIVAQDAGYELFPEDRIETISPDLSLRDGVIGVQLVIDRAIPVKMNLYGTTYDVRTHAETVGDLAKERNISFDQASILPAPETPITQNQVVFVTDPGKQIATSEEEIPFDEEKSDDPGLAAGTTQVRTEGAIGRKAVVYEIGPNGERSVLQEVVITPPVKRVVVRGTKSAAPNVSVAADKATLMARAGISADQHSSADFIISKESGWRPAARSPNNCIGLGQRCNAQILISACPSWETDAVCQLQHFNSYAVGRYGSWNEAYNFWAVNRWW